MMERKQGAKFLRGMFPEDGELIDEYIDEGEHQEGVKGFWDMYSTYEDLEHDFRLYKSGVLDIDLDYEVGLGRHLGSGQLTERFARELILGTLEDAFTHQLEKDDNPLTDIIVRPLLDELQEHLSTHERLLDMLQCGVFQEMFGDEGIISLLLSALVEEKIWDIREPHDA